VTPGVRQLPLETNAAFRRDFDIHSNARGKPKGGNALAVPFYESPTATRVRSENQKEKTRKRRVSIRRHAVEL